MKSDSLQHLDEDQLIQAVVDTTDLPQTVQTHLSQCARCQTGKNNFENELTRLSQKVEQFTPQPQRRILLPVQKSKKPFLNLLDWRNLVAAAAAITAVFILVWGTNTVRNLSGTGTENMTAEMMEAEKLMTEVNTLVDNALPPFYLEISGEKNADYDEEFYQFLVPTIGDKTFSDRGKKGTSLC
jgi:hypothetical protein